MFRSCGNGPPVLKSLLDNRWDSGLGNRIQGENKIYTVPFPRDC